MYTGKIKKITIQNLALLLVIWGFAPLNAWEKFDRVLAVVNNKPIIESEVNKKFEQLKTLKKIKKSKIAYEKSRIIDQLIDNELIYETARQEAIEISDKKVINTLHDPMFRFFKSKDKKDKQVEEIVSRASKNLEEYMTDRFDPDFKIDPDLKKYMDYIEKKEKVDFLTVFEMIKLNIARQQIMSISIGANPPSTEDARKWYRQNKDKLGPEVHVKHILIIPKSSSIADEKEANNRIENIRNKVLAGESFEKLAAKYSQDPGSAANGGDLGWQMLAAMDPYFANAVYSMNKKGSISKVFKSGFGYHIVKYLGRRPLSFEAVEEIIKRKLQSDNMAVLYEKWMEQRRDESAITIYMEDYVEK